MLIVRSLAVYLSATGIGLFLARRYVRRLPWQPCLFLVCAPLLITGRAMFTGGVYAPLDIAYQAHPLAAIASEVGIGPTKTPILGDVVSQEIPWRKAVRDAVKNGRLPLWNRFILAGEPLLAMQQPAVLHPSTWIGMLLPLAQAWTFEMSFTLFLAVLCGFLFLADLGLPLVACCVGATGWAFSDYILFFIGYPLSPAIAPFPLLLLGLSKLAKERSGRSVGITVISLLLIVAGGHSETLLHTVAAAGLYFLFVLKSETGPSRIRAILLSGLAGLITLGLTAVILLPHIEALPHTFEYFFRNAWYAHVKKSVALPKALFRLQQLFIPYAFGSSGHGGSTEGQSISVAYVGSMFFPLAAVGLISARRVKWALVGLGVLGIARWTSAPGITEAVSALPLFDIALNERLVFLGAFSIAGLAALGVEKILEGSADRTFRVLLVAAASFLVMGYLVTEGRVLALQMPLDYLHAQFLLQFVPLCVALLWWAVKSPRSVRLGGAILLGLVLIQRSSEGSWLYPVAPDKAFYPRLSLLDGIRRDQPFRTTSVGFTFLPNISALYELEDVRGYEAMTFKPLFETFPLWCVPQPVWFNRIDDPAKPFLSFLNVKYFLIPGTSSIPTGWPMIREELGLRLVENPHVLARAFVPDEFQVEPDGQKQLQVLADIQSFAHRGVVENLSGMPLAVWIPNGKATVETRSYSAQKFSARVIAQAPSLIATSFTAWPGWRLRIDGSRAPLIQYNHAFLAFVTPAGRHDVELRYMPAGFILGAGLSAATLLIVLAWLAIRHGPLRLGPMRVS